VYELHVTSNSRSSSVVLHCSLLLGDARRVAQLREAASVCPHRSLCCWARATQTPSSRPWRTAPTRTAPTAGARVYAHAQTRVPGTRAAAFRPAAQPPPTPAPSPRACYPPPGTQRTTSLDLGSAISNPARHAIALRRLKVMYSERLAHQIYAAADMMLVPSMFEPCGLTQVRGATKDCDGSEAMRLAAARTCIHLHPMQNWMHSSASNSALVAARTCYEEPWEACGLARSSQLTAPHAPRHLPRTCRLPHTPPPSPSLPTTFGGSCLQGPP
jgi:hypothetical protein